jgi:biopolymer transport protein TolR
METLSAGQRGKIRRASAPRELSPDEEGGELNIVPFLDIIVNVLIFVLATIAVTFTASIETTPPSSKGGGVRQIQSEALNLTIFIVNEGFSIKASGGNVAPGCESAGTGIAVPKKNGQHDYDLLTECATKLKNSSDKFKEENQVFITANPGTDYQTLISVIDAVRRSRNGDILFDSVNFKVSK